MDATSEIGVLFCQHAPWALPPSWPAGYNYSSPSTSLEQYDSLVSIQGRLRCCRLCTYVTVNKTHMREHLCKHTGERPSKCQWCPSAFTSDRDLRKHIRIHTGERPFICGYCYASFSLKGNLKHHMRTHTGERPFTCVHCNASFSMKATLNRHISRRHQSSMP